VPSGSFKDEAQSPRQCKAGDHMKCVNRAVNQVIDADKADLVRKSVVRGYTIFLEHSSNLCTAMSFFFAALS
jgi:hypothetical protein